MGGWNIDNGVEGKGEGRVPFAIWPLALLWHPKRLLLGCISVIPELS